MDKTTHAKRRFLAVYSRTANIRASCAAAKIGRSTYYLWSEHDAEFSAAAAQAREDAGDLLEQQAIRWATTGIPTIKEVYERNDRGELVLVRKERSKDISPTMLIFLLKGAKPQKYRERLEHSAAPTGAGATFTLRIGDRAGDAD